MGKSSHLQIVSLIYFTRAIRRMQVWVIHLSCLWFWELCLIEKVKNSSGSCLGMCYSSHHHTHVLLVLESLKGSGSFRTEGMFPKCLFRRLESLSTGEQLQYSHSQQSLGLWAWLQDWQVAFLGQVSHPSPLPFSAGALSLALYFLTLAPPPKEGNLLW